ncbi:MAG: ABC transporter permease [Dehalococcoidia bacterium]
MAVTRVDESEPVQAFLAPLRDRGGFWREARGKLFLGLASLMVLFLVWWALHLILGAILIPAPLDTLGEVVAIISSGMFFSAMAATLRRVLISFAAAMLVSMALGILMGTMRRAEAFFQVPVILGLTIPGLIWALLAIMFFGLSEISAYFAVFITILPMIAINIWAGAKALDKDLIDMSDAFDASVWSKVMDVIVPQLLSHFLGAARYGLGLAWKVVVVVEIFGFSNGIGYQIIRAFNLFSIKSVLAWTITFLVVMIFIEFGVIGWLESRATAWRPRMEVWAR